MLRAKRKTREGKIGDPRGRKRGRINRGRRNEGMTVTIDLDLEINMDQNDSLR